MVFRREADPATAAFKDVNHGRSGFTNGSRDDHRLGTVRAKQGLGKFYHDRSAGASSAGGVMNEYGACFSQRLLSGTGRPSFRRCCKSCTEFSRCTACISGCSDRVTFWAAIGRPSWFSRWRRERDRSLSHRGLTLHPSVMLNGG